MLVNLTVPTTYGACRCALLTGIFNRPGIFHFTQLFCWMSRPAPKAAVTGAGGDSRSMQMILPMNHRVGRGQVTGARMICGGAIRVPKASAGGPGRRRLGPGLGRRRPRQGWPQHCPGRPEGPSSTAALSDSAAVSLLPRLRDWPSLSRGPVNARAGPFRKLDLCDGRYRIDFAVFCVILVIRRISHPSLGT